MGQPASVNMSRNIECCNGDSLREKSERLSQRIRKDDGSKGDCESPIVFFNQIG